MKTKVIKYMGAAPEVVTDPTLVAIVELFMQQNEILKAAATRTVLVPAGTKLSTSELKEQGNGE